jgi:hypothetical protein
LTEDVQNERGMYHVCGRNKITADFWLGITRETDSWEEIGTAGKTLYDIVKLHVGGGRVYVNLCDLGMDRNPAFVTTVMNHRDS